MIFVVFCGGDFVFVFFPNVLFVSVALHWPTHAYGSLSLWLVALWALMKAIAMNRAAHKNYCLSVVLVIFNSTSAQLQPKRFIIHNILTLCLLFTFSSAEASCSYFIPFDVDINSFLWIIFHKCKPNQRKRKNPGCTAHFSLSVSFFLSHCLFISLHLSARSHSKNYKTRQNTFR